jgi:hypothetical protein
MAAAKPDRSVLLVMKDGSRKRVSGIPASAKITFAAFNPGAKSYDPDKAVRIYTTAGNQLAVFLNVAEFRDEALTVLEQRVTKAKHHNSERNPDGTGQAITAESTEAEWVTA